MIVEGKLILKNMYTGTKSEGFVAFLLVEDDKEYRLYRTEVYPINDSYFSPYEGKIVVVNGEVKDEEYLLVSSIEEKPIDDELL